MPVPRHNLPMDLERTMQFLLEQQAAAEARRAADEARRAADEARHAQWHADFEVGMADLRKNQSAIEQTQVKQLEMIDKLLDLSKRHENRLGDVEVWAKEMKEWSKETKEKLDALIAIVDGLVRRKN